MFFVDVNIVFLGRPAVRVAIGLPQIKILSIYLSINEFQVKLRYQFTQTEQISSHQTCLCRGN